MKHFLKSFRVIQCFYAIIAINQDFLNLTPAGPLERCWNSISASETKKRYVAFHYFISVQRKLYSTVYFITKLFSGNVRYFISEAKCIK